MYTLVERTSYTNLEFMSELPSGSLYWIFEFIIHRKSVRKMQLSISNNPTQSIRLSTDAHSDWPYRAIFRGRMCFGRVRPQRSVQANNHMPLLESINFLFSLTISKANFMIIRNTGKQKNCKEKGQAELVRYS